MYAYICLSQNYQLVNFASEFLVYPVLSVCQKLAPLKESQYNNNKFYSTLDCYLLLILTFIIKAFSDYCDTATVRELSANES